jgi:GNAT superfamily N-acetyltransferase
VITFKDYLLERTNEEYMTNFKGKDIIVRWDDKDSTFGRLRIFDSENDKQMGLIELKYDPIIHQKYGSDKSRPTSEFTSMVEYFKDKIIVGLVLIDKEYRNKGYAKFLLGLAEEYAKEKRIEYLFVEYATPQMLKILQSKFNNIKFRKDPQQRGEYKNVLIKI